MSVRRKVFGTLAGVALIVGGGFIISTGIQSAQAKEPYMQAVESAQKELNATKLDLGDKSDLWHELSILSAGQDTDGTDWDAKAQEINSKTAELKKRYTQYKEQTANVDQSKQPQYICQPSTREISDDCYMYGLKGMTRVHFNDGLDIMYDDTTTWIQDLKIGDATPYGVVTKTAKAERNVQDKDGLWLMSGENMVKVEW